MTAQKHTPGPWRVEQDTTLVWGACNPDDHSNNGMGYPIIDCRITPVSRLWAKGPSNDEGEANARLIAAAPEMLDALKALHLQALQSNVNSPANEWGREALEMASAAIAKAEGQP